MGGGGNFTFSSQMDNERADFIFAHLIWVALVVKEDKAPDPIDIGLFGTIRVMFGAKSVTDLFEQLFPLWRLAKFFRHPFSP